MLSDDEIEQLCRLLNTHRRVLNHLLMTVAANGGKHNTPVGVLISIEDARIEILKIKKTLRSLDSQVTDHPNDEDENTGSILITRENIINQIKSSHSSDAADKTKLACRFVKDGLLTVSVLTELNAHSYWLVRKLAIEQIIESGGEGTLDLLYQFRYTSYHISQDLIRNYVEYIYDQDILSEIEHPTAMKLLTDLNNAPKVTTNSRQKNNHLIEKLYQRRKQ